MKVIKLMNNEIVEKKNGQTEKFEKEKIVKACKKSGAPQSTAEEIASKVEDEIEKKMSSKEIRDMVVKKLGWEKKEWVDNWKEHEKRKIARKLSRIPRF